MRSSSRICAATALSTFLVPLLAQDYLDTVVERARKEFNVPGIAVAVVKDGKVVALKGYGVRRLGDPGGVTPHTVFGIASNTKIFTSAALAMLVDQGNLDWNDRVVDRLPGFQMSDPYVTREMRIRDLLCHRSGLPLGGGDLMFFPGTDFTADQINYRLRFVPLGTSFRSTYAYDNILYNSAGALIHQLSGKSWAEFIRERFFLPLNMRDSKTTIRDIDSSMDAVAPHALEGGKLRPLEHMLLDNNAPAGAIVSSVDDMSRWVIALLNKGDLGNGKRLFSARQARILWTPLTILPVADPPADLAEMKSNFADYAMGEELRDYRGHLLVSHTGGLQGMVSIVAMLPELNAGIVVLTNQEAGGVMRAIALTVLDRYLDAPPKDWVAAFAAVTKRRADEAGKTVREAAGKRDTSSKPSLSLDSYTGRYRDPWYGDVVLERKGDGLGIRFSHTPALAGKLEHWQQDTFVAHWNDRTLLADAYITFSLNPDGTIEGARMKAVSPLTDFSFDFHDLVLKPVAKDAVPY
ncbi:MAG: serine hydrolase [Acidobacteriota bacterium]|nr:serine hydrolase [Acidobacteriota bacterium]